MSDRTILTNALGETNAAARTDAGETYVLQLYVSGTTAKSIQAIINIERICNRYLTDRYTLSVIDIYQNPQRARDAQIIAVPTLIRVSPLPIRRAVGAMSNDAKVLLILDLLPVSDFK